MPVHTAPAAYTSAQKATTAAPIPLEDVVQTIRNAASEVLGADIGADGHFAAGHFDSLAAVELSNILGKMVGRELPGTLVFDYPSVPAAAAYLHSIMWPAAAALPALPHDEAITALTIRSQEHSGGSHNGLIRVTLVAKLPQGIGHLAVQQDAVSVTPYTRCVTLLEPLVVIPWVFLSAEISHQAS
jgi:acyl carrier protein